MCLQGASRVAAALAGLPSDALRTFIAWVPMLPPDTPEAAAATARAFPHTEHYWDRERRLAATMGRALAITAKESIGVDGGTGLAWDVYLAYGPGDEDLYRPRFWMHQLAAAHAPRLDTDEFRRRVGRLMYR